MFSGVEIPEFALEDGQERDKVAREVVRIKRIYYARPEYPAEVISQNSLQDIPLGMY